MKLFAKLFSHGTKSFAKNLCTIPWDKNLCRFFSWNWVHFIAFTSFFRQIDGKQQFCCLMQKFRQFDGKIGKLCKAFYPMGCCKAFLQSFLSHGKKSFAKKLCKLVWLQFDGKNWCCKGNFFQIVYLVNHIEIGISIWLTK